MDSPAYRSGTVAPPPASARRLLQKLRDLDLHSSAIALADKRRVRFSGCLSLDHPAEHDLRYRVALDGCDHVLAFSVRGSWLELELTTAGETNQRIAHRLSLDEEGRITVPDLGARVDPGTSEPRELEHFLRRLVRGLFG